MGSIKTAKVGAATAVLQIALITSGAAVGFFMDNDDYPSVATPKAFSDSLIQARDSERSEQFVDHLQH